MKLSLLGLPFAAAALLACAGCASMGSEAAIAPQPLKPIDTAQFYTGRWYEIARTPMNLTKDCVAGTTDYRSNADGGIDDIDACHMDTPEGKVKSFSGPVTFLNPGQNNKVRVTYTVFGLIPVNRTYWMLDHGDDYQWFIVSDPSFRHVSIFTRQARPDPAEIKQLTARVAQLGYDTSKLEFPAEFPSG